MFHWPRFRSRHTLDETLLTWTRNEPFTVRDLLNGGLLDLGRSGSGKTSSSGVLLGKSIVSHPRSAGLICAPKQEDVAMWRAIFARAGRQRDLLEFDAEGSDLRCNFMEEALREGNQTREVTRLLTTIAETMHSGETRGGGEDGQFWVREQERMIYNAVEILKAAQEVVSAPAIQRLVTTAAFDRARLADPAWRSGFQSRCLERACELSRSPLAEHDFQLAADYWLAEIPEMSERTRSSIMTGVLGLLHCLNTSIVRELISTKTNVSPSTIVDEGKWVLVNMPPAKYGALGSLVNAGWKYLTERAVLKRQPSSGDPFVVIWCDEASQFVDSMDSTYVAQCRGHLGCLVFLAQSLHSFYATLPGEQGKHRAEALLTNFGHRVFHALGDLDTAQWASGLIGNHLETFFGGSTQPGHELFDVAMGNGGYSGNFSTQYQPELQPRVFLNGLRTGGPQNNYCCDAIVVRSGEPFRCGKNWLNVTFSQR